MSAVGSAYVAIGGSSLLEAERAILIYGANARHREGSKFAITAPATVDERGAIQLGAWEPVTQEFVHQLAQELGNDIPRELLPPHVLCRTNEVIAWWSPPSVRTLFFTADKLLGVNGEDFPVPGLVWRLELSAGRLYVRAVAGSDRPAATDPAFVAPFLNVYPQGLVCQGTMRRPGRHSIDSLAEWELGFFSASGSSQLTPRATTHAGQLFGLWPALRDRKRFPEKHLLTSGETVASFLGRAE